MRCIEEYLSYSKFRTNAALSGIYLAEAYREKKLTKHYSHAVHQTGRHLEEMAVSPDVFYWDFLLEYDKFEFALAQKRTKANNLQKVGDTLDAMIIFKQVETGLYVFYPSDGQ